MIGVYSIQIGQTVYVGASIDCLVRHQTHVIQLQNQSHPNKKLQLAFNENHGQILFEVLEVFKDVHSLIEAEKRWAQQLNSIDARSKYPLRKLKGDPSPRISHIRLSTLEHEALEKAAKDVGLTISAFMRFAALERTRNTHQHTNP
jgi:hypothetical protein